MKKKLEFGAKEAVFLDTSVLERDYRLRSSDLLHLSRLGRTVGTAVMIPSVVIADLVAHFHLEYEKAVGAVNRAVSDLDRFLYRTPMQELSIDLGARAGYQAWFADRLKELGIAVRDHPKTSHQQIVERASLQRRPFSEHDRGYKDTLIWESILEYCQESECRVLLVSADHDFGRDSRLHQDLIDDLGTHGLDNGSVLLFPGYEPVLNRLYSMMQRPAQYDDRTREAWASVTHSQLVEMVNVEAVLRSERDELKQMIQAQDSGAVGDESVRLKSISLRSMTGVSEKYSGNGVWKLAGQAQLDVLIESIRKRTGSKQSRDSERIITLTVAFAIWYDMKSHGIQGTQVDRADAEAFQNTAMLWPSSYE